MMALSVSAPSPAAVNARWGVNAGESVCSRGSFCCFSSSVHSSRCSNKNRGGASVHHFILMQQHAQSNDVVDHVSMRRRDSLISACLLLPFALAFSFSGHMSARAAILEADDDEELLERVKQDRKKRLQRQEVISSAAKETGYLQELIYKLSQIAQAIDKSDLSAASSVLGPSIDAAWVQNINIAFMKLSSTREEKNKVDLFKSSLSSLFTSVGKRDVESSKAAFVSSATALENWIDLAGLNGQLKGL